MSTDPIDLDFDLFEVEGSDGGPVAFEDVGQDPPVPDGARLVAEAVRLCSDEEEFGALVERYWRHAPDEGLVDIDAAGMVAATRGHRGLAAQRLPGDLKVSITVPAGAKITVVEIVSDDMPFLVDTVIGALAAHRLELHLLIHPLMVVRRELGGRLVSVDTDVDADEARKAGDGRLVESWIRLEIDLIRDAATVQALRDHLIRVLTDARKAVEDWPTMRGQARAIADELEDAQLPVPDRDVKDGKELLRWLIDDHFTFLGYRQYVLTAGTSRESVLVPVGDSGLGILRDADLRERPMSSLTPEAYAAATDNRLLIITKASSRSTVHRNAYLDYIGIKTFDSAGNITGERRFLGLLATAAYRTPVMELPVIKRKVEAVIERSGLSLHSYSGKDLISTLEDYPRDELFQIRTDDLYETVMGVLRLTGRRQQRLFVRRGPYGRFVSCLVYLPRDRFTPDNERRIRSILMEELDGEDFDHTERVGDSPLARIHVVVRTAARVSPARVDADRIQARLVAATRSWEQDFRSLLERRLGDDRGRMLYARYVSAFPEAYKDVHTPGEACVDIGKMEALTEPGPLRMRLYRRPDAEVRFKVYRLGDPMTLSTVLPMLHSLGARVADERPYEVKREGGTVHLYDFGLVLPDRRRELENVRLHLENAFAALWRGDAESDGFNELIVRAGLTWRQAVILRLYAKYLRQAGTVFTQESMQATFASQPQIAALLVTLFESRFSPVPRLTDAERQQRCDDLIRMIDRRIGRVTGLDEDRILRSYLTLIQATVRTSYFQRNERNRPHPYLSIKLNPENISDLPAPRPMSEIFVYSPRFEGIHLRFGPVARGGVRWSDRRDDFRTEILGLVRAQMVKNAAIVPAGAMGGFVVKSSARDAEATEVPRPEAAADCFEQFVSALLDITDNRVCGAVVAPPDVVRHDGDDPYLVMAGDKGTETFSGIANRVCEQRGFWLGDAFACGGAAAYDRDGMAITSLGAWESVKRHLRTTGYDAEGEVTAIGIGEVSGLFGHGMLVSEQIRLVAAFDDARIFLDPVPDTAASLAERRRLAGRPGSSWADYDTSVISEGGGVWARDVDSVLINGPIRGALGLGAGVASLNPTELVRAILMAPVDLLWNGGTGTYVKASGESDADVADRANDSVRVLGTQLGCQAVVEGGDLGLTQLGRIEFARAGGRVYADFIDNSAGLERADHRVNIKILLDRVVADGELSAEQRDALLADMADEIDLLVLRHNYQHALTLENSREQARLLRPVHRRLIGDLEDRARLGRAIRSVLDHEEHAPWSDGDAGLTTPEFAALLAYTKIDLADELATATLFDDPWAEDMLAGYFPKVLHERYPRQLAEHPLRREIITTMLVNEIVHRGGLTFVYRTIEETGATLEEVARAYVVVRDAFDLRQLWWKVNNPTAAIPTRAQTYAYLDSRRLLDRAVRWLVTNRRAPLDVAAETKRLRRGVAELLPSVEMLFLGEERQTLATRIGELEDMGLPTDLAKRVTRVAFGFGLIDVIELANETGRSVSEVAGVYFALSERFRIDALLTKISDLPRDDRWQTLARMALRGDLYAAHAGLTREVLARAPTVTDPQAKIDEWEKVNATAAAQARTSMDEFDEATTFPMMFTSVDDLKMLSQAR